VATSAVTPLSSVTPLTFTGTSQYASSFQSVLTRAVGIASIPLQQLQNQDQTVLSEETQLATLQGTAASLTTAVQALGNLGANQAISATSSNTANVTVTATGASSPASYTINSITSLASAASETSLTGYADSASTPVSTTGSMSLVIGSQTIPITLTSSTNNLEGLENAINATGAGVTATILTTGNGNYLSVSAENQGATTLQLINDPTGSDTNILTSTNQGSDAVFTLNNLPVTRTSNTVNDLIPGATLTLQAPTTSATTLTLASDPTQLTSGLQTLVSAYNAAVSQINGQAGSTMGVLSGDSIVYQLEGDMQQLSTYQGSGDIKSLADLGITFNSDGTMSFDPTVIGGFSSSQLAGAFQFLGSETTGLGAISQALDQVSDSATGAIATEQTTLQQDDAGLQTQIANSEASINSMQKTLFQQLSQADTLISSLDSQQTILTASIQSLDYTLYGTDTGTNSSSSS
jgi:flagellar hook-associated protein 2